MRSISNPRGAVAAWDQSGFATALLFLKEDVVVANDTNLYPNTCQADLAKLPAPLLPLCKRPQWAVWRWTQLENGRWQKPPFMATQPQRHASTKDPSTWCDYATALACVQAGDADGISYVLTENDRFAAIDLDHCRDVGTHSIDVWAQNFLDAGRHSYSEVTPSGSGCRIWGLATGNAAHKKFSLEISGKTVAVELFRRTNKALTVTGYRLDTVRELANIDQVIEWGLVWGERRKAAATQTAAPVHGHSFNGSGSKYSIDEIEQIVRDGSPIGANRSDVFHSIVGPISVAIGAQSEFSNICSSSPTALAAVTCGKVGCTKRSQGAPASMPPAPCHCLVAMAAG
jgi:hypothetical protein